MRRVLLLCAGIGLVVLAEPILWNGPDLYGFADSWNPPVLTCAVGLAILVEAVLCVLGAALCLGRAVVPLTAAPGRASEIVGGGPVLPLGGILFLLAAAGPFGQARSDAQMLQVMDTMPGQWGADIVDAYRQHERTARNFAVLWLIVGGALLATPLYLKRHAWQLGWRTNGLGFGTALGGFLLSGMGILVFLANGLAMEGASGDLAYVGYLVVLAGAVVAVLGSILAAAGRVEA